MHSSTTAVSLHQTRMNGEDDHRIIEVNIPTCRDEIDMHRSGVISTVLIGTFFHYVSFQYGPSNIRDLKPGKKMKWCACGLSKKMPWCDGEGYRFFIQGKSG